MKISEQWLREWVNPQIGTQELAEQLTMAGLEVDAVEPVAPPLDKVVVGRVIEKGKHPNADKLSLCKVDVGEPEALQIVCGAPNVIVDGVYPVATVGAVLPGDFKIKRSKIRGEASFGMLCSAVELGMGENAEGLLELEATLEPGTPISAALGLDDTVIDLDLTPNRADCFSVVGVARDVAAFNSIDFTEPAATTITAVSKDVLNIELGAGDACPAFAGRVIRNIDATARTPLWMAEKLRRAGVRTLHPVVDVTNYVMLELGQPMHAYDLVKLQGGVSARMAKAKEKLTLLDDQEVTLDADTLVIADESGAVALAGIMGGAATAVDDSTADIFLESAFFSPAVMAGRARRYGLHTDASLRFERGVDFTGQVQAIERATELLLAIVGGEPGPVTDERNTADLPRRAAVQLRKSRLEKLLGVAIPDADVSAMLMRLGFTVEASETGWAVTPTPNRFDIAIEEDLVEEVVRLYGYDQVPEITQQFAPQLQRVTETRLPVKGARTLLVARGYQEVVTYSFVDPAKQTGLLGPADELQLVNPIASDQAVMRRSLWTGLLQVASLNRKRQQNRVRLFETGVIFANDGDVPAEAESIAGLAWGSLMAEHWDGKTGPVDVFDIKSDVEALAGLTGDLDGFAFVAGEHPALRPGRTAQIQRAGAAIGWCGELHPRLARKWGLEPAPILFELDSSAALAANVPAFRPVSRYPSVRRDLAVIVAEEISAAQLTAAASAAAGDLLRDIRVFDIYTGEGIENGLKSVALGLILQETSSTLTELEIDGVMDAVTEQLSSQFNASIRE